MEAVAGLRERKKRRTRRALVAATLELTLEQGFAATTIAQIAARADVAPRTVSTYFPVKEQLVLGEPRASIARLAAHLGHDRPGEVVDRIGEWFRHESRLQEHDRDLELARYRALAQDPSFAPGVAQLVADTRETLASAAARELNEPLGAFGPQTFASAGVAVLQNLRAHLVAHGLDGVEGEVDRGLAFLSAGLATLRRDDRGAPAAVRPFTPRW